MVEKNFEIILEVTIGQKVRVTTIKRTNETERERWGVGREGRGRGRENDELERSPITKII